MKTSQAGIDLIKRWESLRLDAYLCPAGIPTIGYGHTGDVKLGDRITEHQADAILTVDLDRVEREIERIAPNATQGEFDALVSFAFNLGVPALERSGLLRKYLAGDKAGAALEFAKWCHARVRGEMVVLPGLVKRRAAEAALFLGVGS